MSDRKIENVINDLIQTDIDATFAYREAIQSVEEKDIREKLISFQTDHERHLESLSAFLRKMGGEPIKYSQDLKGYVLQGMAWLRSITGTEGALKAMLSNEEMTTRKYKEALEQNDLMEDIRSEIASNYQDDKKHLEYVQQKLSEFKERTI